MSAQERLREIFTKIKEGSERMTAEEQPSRGHTFLNLAMLDGRGGSWTQVYECECGQVLVASCAGRKQAVKQTVIDSDCPLKAVTP